VVLDVSFINIRGTSPHYGLFSFFFSHLGLFSLHFSFFFILILSPERPEMTEAEDSAGKQW
jgi:hypothetical protein